MASRKGNGLSVVKDGARAPRQTPETITEALDGSTRDVLAAMRQQLAKKLDAGDVSSNAIASAYKELRELDRLIRAEDRANESEATQDGGRTRRSFNPAAI